MGFLKTLIQIIYILICAVLAFIVLKQEGKGNDLSGALTGATDSTGARLEAVPRKAGWRGQPEFLLHPSLFFQ